VNVSTYIVLLIQQGTFNADDVRTLAYNISSIDAITVIKLFCFCGYVVKLLWLCYSL